MMLREWHFACRPPELSDKLAGRLRGTHGATPWIELKLVATLRVHFSAMTTVLGAKSTATEALRGADLTGKTAVVTGEGHLASRTSCIVSI